MLHVCSIFVWIMIKTQCLPTYNFKFQLCYLFDLGLVLKFQFSFIYINIIFKFCYLADAFIQSDVQMRTTEAIKTNKRAIICKCCISILLYHIYFNFTKKRAAFCQSNNKKTHLIYNLS